MLTGQQMSLKTIFKYWRNFYMRAWMSVYVSVFTKKLENFNTSVLHTTCHIWVRILTESKTSAAPGHPAISGISVFAPLTICMWNALVLELQFRLNLELSYVFSVWYVYLHPNREVICLNLYSKLKKPSMRHFKTFITVTN